MSLLDLRLPAVALLLGLGLGGGAAWKWQANEYRRQLAEQAGLFQDERLAAGLAVINWNNAEQAKRSALESRLQAAEKNHHQELTDAQQAQARLRDRLATSDLRLSVLIANSAASAASAGCGGVSATPDAGGVVHGTIRAQLDPAHAQRIIGITDDGDRGLIALRACQTYVREVIK
ncbi:lysis system i-spanin subunit Rz [Pseudomonas sp. 148P]|uniref:Lysis system i-spanin subunit Rz n=1 Tax=Pseudomonas ulcerans TaxID=3115852 RepID=A0ABU7HW33_9PSED|nr:MULTISPECIES: lysis system i-spanin subunit Rz [unclassified Pseudomonas]MEE1922914.1 lysis system i-spanin subunit Rz [Pseudomonas sp. 147P]MEE1935764.1 lysis system i-spanin subunit Rz [Pseudomonas sp. 148P]